MQNPAILDFISESAGSGLELKTVISDEKDKVNTLLQLLCHIGAESTLIFCNHREAAERASKHLTQHGIDNAYFHGGLEQMEREQIIRIEPGGLVVLDRDALLLIVNADH